MSPQEELIERLEKAEVGSDELSAQLMCLVAAPAGSYIKQSQFNDAWCIYLPEIRLTDRPRLWEFHGWGSHRDWAVTQSLDAIIALVERKLPGWRIQTDSDQGEYDAILTGHGPSMADYAEAGSRASLPMALCIALLKALAALSPREMTVEDGQKLRAAWRKHKARMS